MDKFDLGRLTDFDFESICKDIFEEILGAQLEIFSPGADAGVDLRHLQFNPPSSTIIQCKHWMRSGRDKLVSHMRTKELIKIRKLAPSRYILASSVEFTKASKDALAKDLSPFVKSSGDIYGLQEIESELRKRPHIVQRHLRLWLSSASVLDSLLAREILVRSGALVEDLQQSLRFYVPNESLLRARDILEERHVVVISGIPGIGKTTLAQVLAAEYVSQGFALIEVSEDIEEANRLWAEDRPQVFYYDDFLGQTTLEDKLHKNEDSRLISLLRRIHAASNKRFLLTTREYILNQARQRYEKISNADFSPMACVLDLADYTNRIRAQILYNHVYFSDLPPKNKAAFARPEMYGRIINHKNFSPRLIHLSLNSFVKGETPEQTVQRLWDNLQSPRRIWQHVVEYQLDDSALCVLEVLFSLAGEVPLNAVMQACASHESSAGRPEQVRRSLKILEGTLIKVSVQQSLIGVPQQGDTLISFHNPSVRDYIREYLSDRPYRISQLIENSIYFEQISALWTAAAGYKGSAMMSLLESQSDALHRAVYRTIDSPGIRGGEDKNLVDRVHATLRIADHLGSNGLSSYITDEILPNIELDDGRADGDDITALMQALAKSQFEAMHHWAELLIDSAIGYALGDILDWDNIQFASTMIDNLERIDNPPISEKVQAARAEVDERIDEMAHDAFERWSGANKAWRNDVSEMQEIIEYAKNSYYDPENHFTSFSEVVAEVDQLQSERMSPRSRNPLPKFDDHASAQEILGSLEEGCQ